MWMRPSPFFLLLSTTSSPSPEHLFHLQLPSPSAFSFLRYQDAHLVFPFSELSLQSPSCFPLLPGPSLLLIFQWSVIHVQMVLVTCSCYRWHHCRFRRCCLSRSEELVSVWWALLRYSQMHHSLQSVHAVVMVVERMMFPGLILGLVICSFVDFRKAFDSFCREALFYKIAKLGIQPGKIFNTLWYFFLTCYIKSEY